MCEKKPHSPPILRLLQGLARSVGNPDEGSNPLRRFVGICRGLLWVVTLGYAAGLVAWLLWLEHFGDTLWCTWVFLYLPPALFLFPLGLLVPLALLFDWRLLVPGALSIVFVFFFYEDLELQGSRSPRSGATCLKVLSNNIGQHGKYRLTPFLDQQNPDLILLQEAAGRGKGYVEQYGEKGLNTLFAGEFICASRYPLLSGDQVADIRCGGRPVAARFVLDMAGRKVVVYNVHIASPRNLLGKLRGRGLVAQFLHDLGLSIGRDYGAQEKVAARLVAAEALAQRVAEETDPVIVAGDFNIPARGRAYHVFANQLTDTFEARGRGYGFTFPGKTRNPFSLFGPWLRLDMVFAGKDWRVLSSMVEPERPSQHRAIVATLELREE
jgi:endonuclease/exonuclease/phosphatase family metal-dependent hydrolase